jgi:hypothetical protein
MTAVGLRVLLYLFFSQWWPSSDHLSASIGETGRAWNHFYANASAVVVTNIFGYVTNVLWVFKGGRHNRLTEFLLFSTVTFSCLILGALFGPLMMAFLEYPRNFPSSRSSSYPPGPTFTSARIGCSVVELFKEKIYQPFL